VEVGFGHGPATLIPLTRGATGGALMGDVDKARAVLWFREVRELMTDADEKDDGQCDATWGTYRCDLNAGHGGDHHSDIDGTEWKHGIGSTVAERNQRRHPLPDQEWTLDRVGVVELADYVNADSEGSPFRAVLDFFENPHGQERPFLDRPGNADGAEDAEAPEAAAPVWPQGSSHVRNALWILEVVEACFYLDEGRLSNDVTRGDALELIRRNLPTLADEGRLG
jgi:hypothetical protein